MLQQGLVVDVDPQLTLADHHPVSQDELRVLDNVAFLVTGVHGEPKRVHQELDGGLRDDRGWPWVMAGGLALTGYGAIAGGRVDIPRGVAGSGAFDVGFGRSIGV